MAEYGKKPVLRAVRGLGFCSRFAFPQQISLLFFGLFMRGNIMKDGHCPMNGAMLVTQGPRCYIRPRAINIIAVTDKNFLVINMSPATAREVGDSAGVIRVTLSARKNPQSCEQFLGTSSSSFNPSIR